MKKIIRLSETELIKVIKKIIKEGELEEDKLVTSPYELSASNGYIIIKNTKDNKSYKYQLQIKQGFWISVNVEDFPGGNSIKASGFGMTKTISLDKNMVKNVVSKNIGKSTIQFTVEGYEIKFVKV